MTPDMTNNKYIEWALDCLSHHDIQLNSTRMTTIKHEPWSDVVRFDTSIGDVYLKATPPLLTEAAIIQCLHDHYQAPVAELIDTHKDDHCFLMRDAGRPLRSVFNQRFDPALACRAVRVFTSLQLAIANNTQPLIAIGVPDWRLERFPTLLQGILSDRNLWLAAGITESTINSLQGCLTHIEQQCKQLNAFNIPPTLVQPDFNDNNMLINTTSQSLTVIDVGEIVISHPFFSLINFLYQLNKHHGITDASPQYPAIHTATFGQFLKDKTAEQVNMAIKLSMDLQVVYGLLAHYRLLKACDLDSILTNQKDKLAHLIDTVMASYC